MFGNGDSQRSRRYPGFSRTINGAEVNDSHLKEQLIAA